MAAQDISQLVVEVQSKGILTATNQLDKLTVASDKAEKAVKKLGTSVVTANTQLTGGVASAAALVAAMTALTEVMSRLSNQQTRTTTTQRANNEAMREAHALARGLSGSLGALWVTYGNFAGMAAGIAIGASLKGIVTIGSEVESTLEAIRVKTSQTGEDMVKMREEVYNVSKGVYGPREVSKALETLALAGLTAKQSMQALGPAVNMAIAGGVSLEKSAEALVTIGTAVGASAKHYNYLADGITMAANSSNASVESIAASVKRASVVNKLYGATFEDILVRVAALSALGIKDSAAGTAVTNMMSDMQGKTDKARAALKELGMEFSDSTGKAKPLLEAMKEFDDKLNKFGTAKQKVFQMDIFGERGMRDVVALRSLLTQAADDTVNFANKFEELQFEIQNAAGASALQAAQMSLTSENTVKGMWNTLQVSLAKTFKDIQPMLNVFAMKMREVFSSPEFATGLRNLAQAAGSLAVAFAQNIGVILAVGEGLLAAKLVMGGMAIATSLTTPLMGAAAAFGAVAVSANGAAVATGVFGTAIRLLPGIGMVLGAITAAFVLLNFHSKKNKDQALETAEAYRTNYLQALTDEADKLERTVQQLKEGKGVREAETQALKDQARAQADLNNQQALAVTQKKVSAAQKALDEVPSAADGGSHLARALRQTALNEAQAEHNLLKTSVQQWTETADKRAKSIVDNSKVVAQAYKDEQKAAEAAAQAAAGNAPGTVVPDRSAVADAYAAAISAQANKIKEAYDDLKYYKQQQEQLLKADKIGDLTFIERVAEKEIEVFSRVSKAIQAQKDIAKNSKDNKSDYTNFQGDEDQLIARAEAADQLRIMKREASERQSLENMTKLRVKSLEDQGQFEEAARVKWSSENSGMYQRAIADAMEYGDVYPHLWDKVEEFNARADAAINAGALKDATTSFNTELQKTANNLKGVKAATQGMSIGNTFNVAKTASAGFTEQLKKAQAEAVRLRDLATSQNTPEAKKAAEEAEGQLLSLADKHKQMWTEVGESIAGSLENAFGRAGKAMGEMTKLSIAYNQNESASMEDRVQYYGDMAGAAKGFFDEGSKGYKTLNSVSKAVHMSQMAMQAAEMGILAVKAVMTQGGGDPYTAWGRMAAMAAVVAGLGYAVGGGFRKSGGNGKTAEEVQKTQGTGGVFGDAEAKSESITKSIELLSANSDIMLPLTQGMHSSLKNIEASMTGLTNLVLRTEGLADGTGLGVKTGATLNGGSLGSLAASTSKAFGGIGPMGDIMGKLASAILGSTTRKIVDAGIQFGGSLDSLQNGGGYNQYASVDTTKKKYLGLSKKTTNSMETQGLSGELTDQFGMIFTNLEDAMKSAAGALGSSGGEVAKRLDDFVLQTTVLSLKDLKGEDLQNAINGVISKAMDDIAETAFPSMAAFRQIGEGYAQTVIRVASGVEQANVALQTLGIQAIGYNDVARKGGDVAEQIVKQSIALKEGATGVGDIMKTISGSLDDIVKSYVELTEARKAMANVGLGNGLNLDTIKGSGDLKSLSANLETFYDKYFKAEEKLDKETAKLTNSFTVLGYTLPTTREDLRKWIEKAASVGDQLKVGQLLGLTDAFDKLATSLENVKGKTKEAKDATTLADDAYGNLKDAVENEKNGMQKAYDAAKKAAEAFHKDRIKAIETDRDLQIRAAKEADKAKKDKLTDDIRALRDQKQALDDAKKLLEGDTKSKLKDSIKAEKEAIAEREKALKTISSQLQSLIGDIGQAIEATKPKAETFSRAMLRIQEAINVSRSGGSIANSAGLKDAVKALSSNSAEAYSSLFEFERSQAEANNALRSLKASGEYALSDAQRQLEALEKQRELLDLQLDALDKQIEAIDKQRDAVDTQTQTLKDALADLEGSNYQNIKDAAERALDAENTRYDNEQELMESRFQREMDKLDLQLRLASDQIDAIKGVDSVLRTVAQATQEFAVASKAAAQAVNDTPGAKQVTLPTTPSGVKSTQAQIETLYQTMLGRVSDTAGMSFWMQKVSEGLELGTIAKAFSESDEYKNRALAEAAFASVPKFDVGTNSVPEDMLAMVHKGERIIPAADNIALERQLEKADSTANAGSSDEKFKEVVALMLEAIKSGDTANVRKTDEMFKLLRDWNANGMPPERLPQQ